MPDYDFDGLTEDEFAALEASSLQQAGEDSTDWAARARREASDAAAKAAARREAATAAEAAEQSTTTTTTETVA